MRACNMHLHIDAHMPGTHGIRELFIKQRFLCGFWREKDFSVFHTYQYRLSYVCISSRMKLNELCVYNKLCIT